MSHPPLPCHICKTPRKFLRYDSKVGKNGLLAKWPVYEPCPNKATHPQILADQRAQKRAKDKSPQNHAASWAVKRKASENKCQAHPMSGETGGTVGILFSGIKTEQDLRKAIKTFREKQEADPGQIIMHPARIGVLYPNERDPHCINIPIRYSKHISEGLKDAWLVKA